MGLLSKWRKRRQLRSIPSELIYEPLHKTLRDLNEDMAGSIKISRKEYPKEENIPIAKRQI